MRTEVEIGPKGGLFIQTHEGEKRYLSQMSLARRDEVLRSALPEKVTVDLKRSLGGIETATISLRPFKFGDQTRWVLDTITIKQPGLLHDATLTVKNPHNTRKQPKVSIKRGVSEHVKAGATAVVDEALYRLLEVDGGLTAVVDGSGEIAGEAAKGFLKSVLHGLVPGLGAAVDASEAVYKNDWGLFADALITGGGTAVAVALLRLPVEVESTLFAGSSQQVRQGYDLGGGAYKAETHFRGLGIGAKSVIAGVGLHSTDASHADGMQASVVGLGARVKAGKTFEANMTLGFITKTSPERSWEQDGLQHTEVQSVAKLGVRGAVRVSDRELGATLPIAASLVPESKATTVHTVRSGTGPDARPVEVLNPETHTLGESGNLLHSAVSGEVVERTITTTDTSWAGGVFKSTAQHTAERLQLAEEITASFGSGESGHTTVMRSATGEAVDDRGTVASSSVGWALDGPCSDGAYTRGAEREVSATFAQVQHATDTGFERVEVERGQTALGLHGGAQTSGTEHGDFAFVEQRHTRIDAAGGAYTQTTETVRGKGSRDKVLDPSLGKVAITAESRAERIVVELNHTEETNFFRNRVHETKTTEFGVQDQTTEHQADALPSDAGPSLAFDDLRTAELVADSTTYTALGGHHQETDVNANLLFTKTTIQLEDLDADGIAIEGTSFREVEIHTSVHVNAAMDSAKFSLRDDAICFLINTRSGKPTAAEIAGHVGTAMGKEFATSVVASKLAGIVGSERAASSFAAATVSATFELVHGRSKAAAKIAFEAAANEALHSVLGEKLQLSYSQRTAVANGGLFGSRVKSAVVKSHNLDAPVPGMPGVTMGVHFERESLEYVDRKGRTVHREAYGVGGHVAAGPASAGVSLSHGTEVAEPTVREEGDLTITETWQRSFSGELNARLSVGNRMATLRIPAWRSTTVEWKFTRRTDGEPLRVTDNLPLRYLAPVTVNGPAITESANPADVGAADARPAASTTGGHMGEGRAPDIPQGGVAAAIGDSSALLGHTLEGGGKGIERVYEKGEKTTTERKNLGTSKQRIYEDWEYGTRTDVSTAAGSTTVIDGVRSETAVREEIHVNYDDLVHVHKEKSRMGQSNKHEHNYYQPGERRTERVAEHTEDQVEVLTREDGGDLVVRKRDDMAGGAAGTRTEHDTAKVRHTITDKLNPAAPAEHRSETHGWYETMAEHDLVVRDAEGDRKVEVQRVDTAAGSYVDMVNGASLSTRHEVGHNRATVVQELTRHADSTKALAVYELQGERSIGGVAGTTNLSVGAEIFTAVANTSELDATHESIQSVAAVGGFRHTSEEQVVLLDIIKYPAKNGAAAVREVRESTIVEGHWEAELASKTATGLESHDAAVEHRIDGLRNEAVEVPDADIAYIPTSQIDRSIAVTQSAESGGILASRHEQVAEGHTRSHYTRRVDTVRDAHRTYGKAGELSREVSLVENTVFVQGARVDAVTASSSSVGEHPLLQDTHTSLTEETRGYTSTERWEGDDPAAGTKATEYSAGHVAHRRQQTVASEKGWFTHTNTITEVNEQLNASGEVTNTSTETKSQGVLSGGSNCAAASLGGALGGAVVELVDALITKKEKPAGPQPQTLSTTARVAHAMLNATEAFATGVAAEGIASGAVSQGAAMVLVSGVAAEAVRWAAHTNTDADIDKSSTLSAEEKTIMIETRRRQQQIHSAANVVTTAAAACSVASNIPVVGALAGVSIVGATAARELTGNDPSDGRSTMARTGDVLMQAGRAGSNLVTRGTGAILRGAAAVAESAGAVSVGEALSAAGTTVARVGLAEAAAAVDAVVKTVKTVQAYRDPSNLTVTSHEQVAREVGSCVAGGVAGIAAASIVATQTAAVLAASTGTAAFALTMAPFVAAPIAIYLASHGVRWLWTWVFGNADKRADSQKLDQLCSKRKLATNATDEEVRARYKKLAREYHPDHKTGSHDAFLAFSTDFELIRELRERLNITAESRESWSQHVVHVLHDISAKLGSGLGRIARALGVAQLLGMTAAPIAAPMAERGALLALESAS